jgi:hypothetical protein
MYQFLDETNFWKLARKDNTITVMLGKKHYNGKGRRGAKNTKTIVFS